MAERGDPEARKEAQQWLRKAVNSSPKDPELLASLAYLEQKRGAVGDARELYERALKQDPTLLDAATNLGVLDASGGDLKNAVTLWQNAFQRAPGRSRVCDISSGRTPAAGVP